MRRSFLSPYLMLLMVLKLAALSPAQAQINVSIVSPVDGGTVIGPVNITGTSSGLSAPGARVVISIDGGPFLQANGKDSWSFLWDSTSIPDGNRSIRARAGNFPGDPAAATQTVEVVVENNGGGSGSATIPVAYPSSVDGAPCTGNIWVPPGIQTATDVPLVVYFGGGQGDGSINPVVLAEAEARGWMVLGLAGRAWPPGTVTGAEGDCTFPTSMAYLDHPDPTIGAGQQDILDGIDWAVANYPIDEDRVYVCGFSLGGRGTYMMGLKVPDRFAAIAPFAPATDMFELDIRTSTTRQGYPCRMAIAGGVPGTGPMSDALRSIQSARFLIENAYNLPVFHGHGTLDDLANNIPASGLFLHGFHMINDTSWNGQYVYEGKIFDFGHTPTLSELNARHPDGYDFAYMFTNVDHALDRRWLEGTHQSQGQGVPDPADPARLLGVFDFFASRTRIRNPNTVVYKSYTDDLRKAYWVEIDITQPWMNQPGAVRATRDLALNRIGAELSHIDTVTFDLEIAQLELDDATALSVVVEPIVEPAFDPALDASSEPLVPTLAIKGDFSALDGAAVTIGGVPADPSRVSFAADLITVGPLPEVTVPVTIEIQGTVTPPGGFASWMLDRGETDPLNDPTGSGLNNLLTYAFGADLTNTPLDALPSFGIASFDIGNGPQDFLACGYRLRDSATDITVTQEFSTDLIRWQDLTDMLVGVETVANGDGTTTFRFRETVPIDPATLRRKFVRTRIAIAGGS